MVSALGMSHMLIGAVPGGTTCTNSSSTNLTNSIINIPGMDIVGAGVCHKLMDLLALVDGDTVPVLNCGGVRWTHATVGDGGGSC